MGEARGTDARGALIEHELKPLVVGTEIAPVRAAHQAMLRETEYCGSFGLAMFGIAAVDTALWDAFGKTHGPPPWQLCGAFTNGFVLMRW